MQNYRALRYLYYRGIAFRHPLKAGGRLLSACWATPWGGRFIIIIWVLESTPVCICPSRLPPIVPRSNSRLSIVWRILCSTDNASLLRPRLDGPTRSMTAGVVVGVADGKVNIPCPTETTYSPCTQRKGSLQ